MLVGTSVDRVATATGAPVYSALPALRVPDIQGYLPSNWTITVRTSAAAATATLADLGAPDEPTPLDALVSGIPFGLFDIAVRGPLGSDLRGQFAVVPELEVTMPPKLLFPVDRGAEVTIAAARGVTLGGLPSGEPLTLAIPDDGDEVKADAAAEDVKLELHVRAAKLLWAFKYEDQAGTLANTAITLDRTDIEDGHLVALLVSTLLPGVELEVALEARAKAIQVLGGARSSLRDGRWAFDLRPLRDTLRASDEPLLELVLTAAGTPVVAARIVSRPAVSQLRAQFIVKDAEPAAQVAFEDSRRLRGRVVRLWSLQRPWEAPICSSVLDDRATEVLVQSDRLSPGQYRVEVAVEDGWFDAARPSRAAANTADLQLGSDAAISQRLRLLNPEDAHSALELAVVDGYRAEGLVLPSAAAVSALLAARALLKDAAVQEPLSRSLRAVADLAVSDAPSALDAVSELYLDGALDRIDIQALAILAIERGGMVRAGRTAESTIRTLWQASPALAVTLDIQLASEGDQEASDRCDEFLGWRPGEALPVPGEGTTLQWLGASSGQVALIREALGIVPQRLLGLDPYAVANFEWLLAAKQDNAYINEWWRRFGWLERDEFPSVPLASSYLLPRKRPIHPDRWAGFPQAILAAALSLTSANEEKRDAAEALLAAVTIAPRLVDHDLCLARLLTLAV
jgi:hypothetical protein